MSKFRRKPLVVEAELYRKGLEDGFDGCGRCPTFKWENGLDDCSKCGSGRPFICTSDGKQYMRPGDYVIIAENGQRLPYKSYMFEAMFEPVE